MLELPSPCLVVLVGPPASGKSTWAHQHLSDHVVSSDALRALVGESEHDLRASADAFDVLDAVVSHRMARHLTTVVDSLGTDPVKRQRWRQVAAAHGVASVAVLFDLRARRGCVARTVPAGRGCPTPCCPSSSPSGRESPPR